MTRHPSVPNESSDSKSNRALREIRRGLFEPSALSLVVAFLTALTVMGTYTTFATQGNIVRFAPYLATDEGDDDIFVTAEILSLREREQTGPAVYLLGDSGMRESIMESQLETELADAGVDLPVVDLRSGGQTLLDTLAIVDNLPGDASGIVVMGISPTRLVLTRQAIDHGINGTRRGFTSPAADAFLARSGHAVSRKYGQYGIDNFRFLLPRIAEYGYQLGKPPVRRVVHQSTVKPRVSADGLRRLGNVYMNKITLPFDAFADTVQVGEELVLAIRELLDERGDFRLMAVEAPLNPDFIDERLGSTFYSAYQDYIVEFLDRHEIDYLDPKLDAPFLVEDFRDVTHLIDSGAIGRFTSRIAEEIAGPSPNGDQR